MSRDKESQPGFKSLTEGRKVLVSGGTGSFGSTFVRLCLEQTQATEIIVFSRDEQKHVALKRRYADPRLRCVLGDVRDLNRLRLALRGVDVVFNAAAIKHVHFSEEHPLEAVATNVQGAYNVCQAALENGVEALISLSTDKAVEPVNVMGMSKALHERVVGSFADRGMRVGIVRYGNVLASKGSVVPYFKQLLENGADRLPVTHRRMTRFVLTLEESVNLVLRAFALCRSGETFVLDVPAFEVLTLAETMARSVPWQVGIEEVGIRPGEKLHETLISAEEMRRCERRDGFWVIRRYRSGDELIKPAEPESSLVSDRAPRLGPAELRDLLEREGCLPMVTRDTGR